MGDLEQLRQELWPSLKFAGAVRGKSNLLNHLRQNSLTESVHVIGCADVHKSSNL